MYQRRDRDQPSPDSSDVGRAPGKRTLTGGLPPRLADRAGAQLGQDFSSVTVHQDGSAERLGTTAYARGDQLHFQAGAFRPDTAEGVAMIGHELAHVAQQRSGQVAATGARGGVAVNTDPALEQSADAAGAAVAQGFDLDEFCAFGFDRGGGASGGVVQGLNIDSAETPAATPATATGAAAPAAPAASPVPPEALARVGATFRHTEDTTAVRYYRITEAGGFLVVSSDGVAIGKLEFCHDNEHKTAWTTLAGYVVAHQADIPPTKAALPAVDPGDSGTDASAPDPWSFEGITGAIGDGLAAIGDTVVGAVKGGLGLVTGGLQAIDDAINAFLGTTPTPNDGTAPTPTDGTPSAPDGITLTPGAAPDVPVGDPTLPPPTLGAVPGSPQVPDGQPLTPTVTAMTASVGEGGTNNRDDVVLVQARLRDLGYPVNSTGTIDDATVRAIKLFQAARTAKVVQPGQQGSLVKWIDGRIDKGGQSEKALMDTDDALRFTTIAPTGVKPIDENPQKSYDASTGETRLTWNRIMAIWNRVSPYLPGDATMSSGYRTSADQARIINGFYSETYKNAIIAVHGEADWAKYVGLNDDASIELKRQRVTTCTSQDVGRATAGGSPHMSGKAIDVGGKQHDADQILALLRFAIEIDASVVASMLYETNGCVHFEFTP